MRRLQIDTLTISPEDHSVTDVGRLLASPVLLPVILAPVSATVSVRL